MLLPEGFPKSSGIIWCTTREQQIGRGLSNCLKMEVWGWGGLEGDWAKLPSVTFKPTNRICFCSVNQIGASSRCECESNSQFRWSSRFGSVHAWSPQQHVLVTTQTSSSVFFFFFVDWLVSHSCRCAFQLLWRLRQADLLWHSWKIKTARLPIGKMREPDFRVEIRAAARA